MGVVTQLKKLTLLLSLSSLLVSCDNQSPTASPDFKSTEIDLSQTTPTTLAKPSLFVDGQPQTYQIIPPTSGKLATDMADLPNDLSLVQTQLTSELNHLEERMSGNFFVQLNTQFIDIVPARLWLSFAETEVAILICEPCTINDLNTTITGINPLSFGLKQGPITLELWLQSEADINNQQIALLTSASINWQTVKIEQLNYQRSQGIQLDWQAPNNAYQRFNVYWRQAGSELWSQKLALSETQFLLTDEFADYEIKVTGISSHGEDAFSDLLFIGNHPPSLQTETFYGDEDKLLTGQLAGYATDPEQQSVHFNEQTYQTAHNGQLKVFKNGDFEYQPAANFSGEDQVQISLHDTYQATANGSLKFMIAAQNDAPIASDDQFNFDKHLNSELELTWAELLANDSDPDLEPLTISQITVLGTPDLKAELLQSSVLISADKQLATGQYQLEYQVKDPQGATDNAIITINFAQAVPELTAVNDAFSGKEDTAINGQLTENDIIDESLSYSVNLKQGPVHGALILNEDGSFQYTPSANYFGSDSFSYWLMADDLKSSATVQIDLTAVNDSPLAKPDYYTFTAITNHITSAQGVLINDLDPDGDELTVSLVNPAKLGTVTLDADGAFSFTRSYTEKGNDSFDYKITDKQGLSASTRVYLTLSAINSPPYSETTELTFYQYGNIDLSQIFKDDTDTDLQIELLDKPANGLFKLVNNTFSYYANTGFSGRDSAIFKVTDKQGASSEIKLEFVIKTSDEFNTTVKLETLLPTPANDLLHNANMLYVTDDLGIRILDAFDSFRTKAEYNSAAPMGKMILQGNHLFVLEKPARLKAFNVKQQTLNLIDEIQLQGEITDFVLSGSHLLLNNKYGGLDFVLFDDKTKRFYPIVRAFNNQVYTKLATNNRYLALYSELGIQIVGSENVTNLDQAAIYPAYGVKDMLIDENNVLHILSEFSGYQAVAIEPALAGTATNADLPLGFNFKVIYEDYSLQGEKIYAQTGQLVIVSANQPQQLIFKPASDLANTQTLDISKQTKGKISAISLDADQLYLLSSDSLLMAQYQVLIPLPSNASDLANVQLTDPVNFSVTQNSPFNVRISYQAQVSSQKPTHVEFYQGDTFIGQDSTAPYEIIAYPLADQALTAELVSVDGEKHIINFSANALDDSDGDGVSDLYEISQLQSSTSSTDSDADGLSDREEAILFTDATLADTDNDGISDLDEYQAGTAPRHGDTMAPSIISSWPENGQQKVCVQNNIQFSFNEEIDRRYLSNKEFYLITQKSDKQRVRLEIESYGKSIYFYPQTVLMDDANYRLEVTNIYDLQGNLAPPVQIQFTTASDCSSSNPITLVEETK
ncbi:Ig-like domain-containing protein [Gayadomonas joobiniege]|uniref:Ig-like domain-containing protein n=1 Tax=Gayadomonas joobiniege TaxID=1234606 RepID=UPI000365485D|nr:Ig-like domain-containing protein [Gayadomonas joobiniege]